MRICISSAIPAKRSKEIPKALSMERIAEILTAYVVKKDMVTEEEREIYKYGYIIALEIALCILTCFVISLTLHTVLEGILFFCIFIPLRSYAGGLHLKSYWSCYLLSCLTFGIIMLLGKTINISTYVMVLLFGVTIIVIYRMYPVENENREVDFVEDRKFKKKLKQFLTADGVLVFLLAGCEMKRYLYVVILTLVMVAITMAIGKYKNNSNRQNG